MDTIQIYTCRWYPTPMFEVLVTGQLYRFPYSSKKISVHTEHPICIMHKYIFALNEPATLQGMHD